MTYFLLIHLLAMLGFCISLYIHHIEKKVAANPEYKAACDISEKISCTKTLRSDYASLFMLSNATVGMLYYALIAVLSFFQAPFLLFVISAMGCIASGIMAYILFFKIKTLCILCAATYGINLWIFASILYFYM